MHGSNASRQFEVGDTVPLKCPPAATSPEHGRDGIGRRLLPLVSGTVYEVYKTVGRNHVIVRGASILSRELGFAQSIAS